MKTLKSLYQEHIVKVGDKFRLVSKSTGKNLGTYPTRAGAENRERQVQYFKHAEQVEHFSEEADKKDTVTFDIPLLIRVLELAREDVKDDMELHRIVERLLDMRHKGVLTMDDYDAIAQLKEDAGAGAVASAGPTNVVGGGAIAGSGGKGGEPGVPKNRTKRNPVMMGIATRKPPKF
jgi:hypothetical protein